MVSEHATPRAAKSAERMDGAIIAGGVILSVSQVALLYNHQNLRWFSSVLLLIRKLNWLNAIVEWLHTEEGRLS